MNNFSNFKIHLCRSHFASFPSNPGISLASGVITWMYLPTSAAAAFLSLLVRIGDLILAMSNLQTIHKHEYPSQHSLPTYLRPGAEVLVTLFLGGGGELLLGAAILLFSFFFLRVDFEADCEVSDICKKRVVLRESVIVNSLINELELTE